MRALDDVSMSVEAGEIRALLGENGAGKSTLGKIVAGVYARSQGSVFVDGIELASSTKRQPAISASASSTRKARWCRSFRLPRTSLPDASRPNGSARSMCALMRERPGALIAQLGVAIDPARKVTTLSPAQAQIVEIAKALSRDLRILILDEPTAALR